MVSVPVFSPFNPQIVCFVLNLHFGDEVPGILRPQSTALDWLVQTVGLAFDYATYQLDNSLRSLAEQAVPTSTGIAGLFDKIYPELKKATDCDEAAIYLWDPETRCLRVERSSGSLSHPLIGDEEASQRVISPVEEDGPLVQHVTHARPFIRFSSENVTEYSSDMTAPVVSTARELLGAVRCWRRGDRPAVPTSFSTVDLHALEVISRSLGPGVEGFLRLRTGSGLVTALKQVSATVWAHAYELQALLDQTIETAVAALNAEVGSIYLVDDCTKALEDQRLELRSSAGHAEDLRGKATYQLGEGLTGASAAGVINLRTAEEIRRHPAFRGKHDSQIWGPDRPRHCETFLGVPIAAERVIGVWKVANIRPTHEHPDDYFTDEDVQIALVLSSFLAYAVEHTRQAESWARKYDSLTRSSVDCQKAQTEGEAIMAVLLALEESHFPNAMVSLYHDDSGLIEGENSSGQKWQDVVPITKRPLDGDDILALVLRSREAAFIADSSDPASHCNADAVAAGKIRAQYILPLDIDDELIGTLQVDMEDRQELDPDDERLLQAFASHLAVSISRLRSIRRTSDLHDDITSGSRFIVAETLASMAVHQVGHRIDQILRRIESDLKDPKIRDNRITNDCLTRWHEELEPAEDQLRNALSLVRSQSAQDPQQTDVHREVQASIDIWIGLLQSEGVHVQPDLRAEATMCPIAVRSFREVISVLLVNSVQAHSKRIRIATHNADDIVIAPRITIAKALVVEVADDGVGITADDPEQLFLSSYTTKPDKFGTGLGLFIARRLAREACGELKVAGQGIGAKGVTFQLILPVV